MVNSKVLVTELGLGINALTCLKQKDGQLSSFTGKEEHIMMLWLFVFQGVRYQQKLLTKCLSIIWCAQSENPCYQA